MAKHTPIIYRSAALCCCLCRAGIRARCGDDAACSRRIPADFLPNLEWAKDTVNQTGGIGGRKLVFDYFDIQKDTLSSVAQRIAQDPNYPAVIGAGTSEMLLAVSDDFVRYRKPLVSFTSTSAEVLRPQRAKESFGGRANRTSHRRK